MMLKLENISKSYGNKQTGNYQLVIDNISFEIKEGDKIAITGPSGSGKTTLLNIIGTLDKPDQGFIYYKENEITQLSGKKLVEFRNQEIGFIFQMHHLLPQCTVLENVLIPTLPNKKDLDAIARAEELIRRVGLWDHRHKKPQVLSGGECQRVAVIRALINNPELILADEPTGSLDDENTGNLMDLLMEISKDRNLSLLMVTHSIEIAKTMDRIYRLKEGHLDPVNTR